MDSSTHFTLDDGTPAAFLFVTQYVGFALYVIYKSFPSPVSFALGIAPTPDQPHLLALGLVAGSLSFGGAYTSIPVIQAEAVVLGGWLPQRVFIDGIAIGNVLPAPLVIFATFVGFQGGYTYGGLGSAFAGAVLITLGMWMPCFIFTIAGHELLEKLVRNKVRELVSETDLLDIGCFFRWRVRSGDWCCGNCCSRSLGSECQVSRLYYKSFC